MTESDNHEANTDSELLKTQNMPDLNAISNEPMSKTDVPPRAGPKLGKMSCTSATGTYKNLKFPPNLVAPRRNTSNLTGFSISDVNSVDLQRIREELTKLAGVDLPKKKQTYGPFTKPKPTTLINVRP
jgi:hypothetical protein